MYTKMCLLIHGLPYGMLHLEDVKSCRRQYKEIYQPCVCGNWIYKPPIDATNMDYLYLDIWTPNSTVFKVKLVDFGNDGVYAGGDACQNLSSRTIPYLSTWVSYDIPLSSFTGLAARKHLAQMILSGSASI